MIGTLLFVSYHSFEYENSLNWISKTFSTRWIKLITTAELSSIKDHRMGSRDADQSHG